MGKPNYFKRVNRDLLNFSHRRGALGVVLLLADSVFQIAYLYLLWIYVVGSEFESIRSRELPRNSLFMSEMHFPSFNFYLIVYTLITVVPQVVAALICKTKARGTLSYLICKAIIGVLGMLNLHVICLVFTPLGSWFKPITG